MNRLFILLCAIQVKIYPINAKNHFKGDDRLKEMKRMKLDTSTILTIILVGIIGGVTGLYAYSELYLKPRFTIVDHNGDLGIGMDENLNWIYNYTVYLKIKNTGTNGTKIVYCEITNWDLTTCIKEMSVSLEKDQEKIITFFFSNQDLHSGMPKQYKIWIK